MVWKRTTNEEESYWKEKDRAEINTITPAALEQYFVDLVSELNLRLLDSVDCGRDRMLWVEDIVLTGYEESVCAAGHRETGLFGRMRRAAGYIKDCLAKLREKCRLHALNQ